MAKQIVLAFVVLFFSGCTPWGSSFISDISLFAGSGGSTPQPSPPPNNGNPPSQDNNPAVSGAAISQADGLPTLSEAMNQLSSNITFGSKFDEDRKTFYLLEENYISLNSM